MIKNLLIVKKMVTKLNNDYLKTKINFFIQNNLIKKV